jgi:hypothetical protein
MSGSTTLTLFLEILLDLSQMIYESDVFDGRIDRRLTYRTTRNLVAQSVLTGEPADARLYAQKCSKLTWNWLSESRPDLMASDLDMDVADDMFAANISDEGDKQNFPLAEISMKTRSTSAVQELREFDEKRNDLEKAAAVELGCAVINGGGLMIEPSQLQILIERIAALGVDEATRRLLED